MIEDFLIEVTSDFKRFTIAVYASLLFRYLFFVGLGMLIFYVIRRRHLFGRRIQPSFPKHQDYWREFAWSLLTLLIFTAIGWLAFCPELRLSTHWYFHISDLGVPYFIISILIMIVVHDAYFYWTHRFMHWPPVHRIFHRVHHKYFRGNYAIYFRWWDIWMNTTYERNLPESQNRPYLLKYPTQPIRKNPSRTY
jgi:sterol desaturase/sphingolipid hydroxylase (fatty acid hydroxylase superfamily)